MIIQLHSKNGSSSTFILRALITCSVNRPRVMQILKINSVKVCFVLTYISDKKKKHCATPLKGHWIANVVIFTHPTTCGHCRMEQKWCKGQHRHLQWRSFLAVVGDRFQIHLLYPPNLQTRLLACILELLMENHDSWNIQKYWGWTMKIHTIRRPNGLKVKTTGSVI